MESGQHGSRSIDRAGRSGMLSSLGSNSAEMQTVVDLVKSIGKPPRFIEVAGTIPFFFQPAYFDALFGLTPPSNEYDGVIERKSAMSTDFIRPWARHRLAWPFGTIIKMWSAIQQMRKFKTS